MRSLLQQLENNEAILLMYLSGELDAQDQAEVSQLLGADRGLAAQLKQMEMEQTSLLTTLATLDPPTSDATAARRLRDVSRLIKRWQVEQLTRPPAPVRRHTLGVPRWAYPVAAAAAVLCLVLGWWGLYPDSSSMQNNLARDDSTPTRTDARLPVPIVALGTGGAPAQATPRTSIGSVWPLTQPDEAVAADESANSDTYAQQQALALTHRADDASSTASIFMTDNND
jgi:anti-sigma factor RsiW